ncbi:hypothetical protein VQ237_000994 [Salmonella enterica]|nr:hypothetical protein [Salmonella enterica]
MANIKIKSNEEIIKNIDNANASNFTIIYYDNNHGTKGAKDRIGFMNYNEPATADDFEAAENMDKLAAKLRGNKEKQDMFLFAKNYAAFIAKESEELINGDIVEHAFVAKFYDEMYAGLIIKDGVDGTNNRRAILRHRSHRTAGGSIDSSIDLTIKKGKSGSTGHSRAKNASSNWVKGKENVNGGQWNITFFGTFDKENHVRWVKRTLGVKVVKQEEAISTDSDVLNAVFERLRQLEERLSVVEAENKELKAKVKSFEAKEKEREAVAEIAKKEEELKEVHDLFDMGITKKEEKDVIDSEKAKMIDNVNAQMDNGEEPEHIKRLKNNVSNSNPYDLENCGIDFESLDLEAA